MNASSPRFITYERVSTARLGQSGLGLEAQRNTIYAFVGSCGADVLARFTEVESGRKPSHAEPRRRWQSRKRAASNLATRTVLQRSGVQGRVERRSERPSRAMPIDTHTPPSAWPGPVTRWCVVRRRIADDLPPSRVVLVRARRFEPTQTMKRFAAPAREAIGSQRDDATPK